MNDLVCGRMKQGKTTFALWKAKQWSPAVVVWDPRHMINGSVVTSAEEFQDAIDDRIWEKGCEAVGQPIVFRPDLIEMKEQFADMIGVLFTPPEKYSKGGFALVIDEASQLQGPQWINPYLDIAVRQHPRSVYVVQATHSLQDWNRNSKDLMSNLYCFHLQGKSLDSVVEYTDGDEVTYELIKNLPDHHIFHFDFTKRGGNFDVIDDPASWYSPATKNAQETSTQGTMKKQYAVFPKDPVMAFVN